MDLYEVSELTCIQLRFHDICKYIPKTLSVVRMFSEYSELRHMSVTYQSEVWYVHHIQLTWTMRI